MKNYIRILTMVIALLFGAVSGVWAQLTNDDIEIEVKPGNAGCTVTKSVNATTREVTLTVTPASDYYIKASNIIVEKLVNPGKANAPKRRISEITNDIVGKMYSGSGRTDADIISSVTYPNSAQYVFTLPADYDGAYVTATFHLLTENEIIRITRSTSLGESPSMSAHYVLVEDVSASVVNAFYSAGTFTGTFEGEPKTDGTFPTISGLSHAIFQTIDGGTVKNIVLDNVSISGSTTVTGDTKKATGAIANIATGSSRIYNCGIQATGSSVSTDDDGYTLFSTTIDAEGNAQHTVSSSTVSGDDYVGGIVGFLDGSARVINCYSYADITSGSNVGGIVGYNNYQTTAASDKLKTMVMNCMFYGNLASGNKAPIYNGKIITNVGNNTGVSNYNYFWAGASYVGQINTYNCALSAETRYLQRFEFFRHLLNGHRELAAWWVQGTGFEKDEMAKWVMEPSQIGTTTPYPILKAQGKYPSVVNYEPSDENIDANNEHYNEGRKLGTLSVTIRMGTNSPFGAPTGARLKSGQSIALSLPITDKDPAHFNFNYGKVQLPYYNDYGVGNYTKASDNTYRVVTGWKIVGISGGTQGSFSSGSDATASVNDDGDITLTTPYNFADRNCTAKDIYSDTNKRVFNQGAYFDVPEGVTSITIEPYWGKAVFIADASFDVVYNQDMTTAYNVPNVGGDGCTNGTSYTFTTKDGNIILPVYTKLGDNDGALAALSPSGSVCDNALVLVGNFHNLALSSEASNLPYTIMSADFNHDNEPDYSYILRFNDRKRVHPVRLDFLDVIGLGMAQKSTGGQGTYNLGIMQPLGWFECTNTGLFRVTQFEYDRSGRANSPMILQGGVIEQWVTVAEKVTAAIEAKSVTYYHLGGNVWFKEFHIGAHQDKNLLNNPDQFVSPHPPISVTGGDFDEFYLTGLYNTPNKNYDDNAECYINGGRFGKVCGTGMQGIGGFTKDAQGNKISYSNGNIVWQIDNADIDEFYAGGINAAHIAEGYIATVISNSRVDQFCGGPKFGNMNSDKNVATNATNCIFRTFFGAGYGGNSYNRRYPDNKYDAYNYSWNSWLTGAASYNYSYDSNYNGVETRIDYQFIPKSDNTRNVARLFIDYVSFSLATTHGVTSKLTGCTITTSPLGRLKLFTQCIGNFYGGGSLGKVTGDVKSTLTNCTVEGNVFGGGYSASLPTVDVMNNSFQREPSYDTNTGAYTEGILPTTEPYTWEHSDEVNSTATAINTNTKKLFTTEDLTGLGKVEGDVILIIDGNTTLTNGKMMSVAKSIYGGGEESGVDKNTEVYVKGGTIGTEGQGGVEYGNVYGGGKGKADNVTAGLVKGSTSVSISGSTTILHNVYGGGAYGSVGEFVYDATSGMPTARKEGTTGGNTTVTIKGGTVGTTGKENGMVFGSSRGDVATPGTDGIDPNDRLAWVYSTHVTIGDASANTSPQINGSVYGSGENGHTFNNTRVDIVKGAIGITTGSKITEGGVEYNGARYPYRGNVYGGGCGTDTYTGTDSKTYYNPLAGVVWGNANVNMTGGHVVHNVYGAGAMGSVGKFTYVDEAYNTANSTTLPIGKPYQCADGTGLCTVSITGGKVGMTGMSMTATGGPDDYGHVFGAGRGDVLDPLEYPNIEIVGYVNNTAVTIGKTSNTVAAFVTGSVYGGSESGHVLGNTNVTVSGGQIGCGEDATAPYTDWSATSMKGTAHWTYTANGAGAPYDKFAGTTGYDSKGGATTATDGHTFYGNVFGGGSGYYPYAPGKWLLTSAGRVEGTATITITDGHILNNVYGGCEMADILGAVSVTMTGGTVGVPRTKTEIEANPTYGNIFGAGMGDKRIFFNTSTNVASSTVSVSNGTVYGSVYGGGEDGHVLGAATTTISQPAEKTTIIGCDGTSGYDGNVFGGGQGSSTALTAGVVGGNVSLEVQGGTLSGSVYGGGRIASVGTYFAMATDPRYGKMQDGDDHGVIAINLTGGTINQNVFGGCMGTIEDAALGVSKNVTVKLNENGTASTKGCIVKGDIFGCNNVNSSPQGDVTVHIYATQNANTTQMGNTAASGNTAAVNGKTKGTYDVHAVYGGGNLAAYKPVGPNATPTNDDGKNTTKSTKVIIDGCGLTSIETVYGGGNAASTPATEVTVNGTFEINELFGGGNGYDALPNGDPNPGANVGFYDYSAVEAQYPTKEERASADFINNYTYGTGKASVNVYGGTIHRVFGGSNTKGNVRQTALTLLDDNSGCEFCVDEAYGGGKSAPMDAEAKLLMACIPGLRAAYGGAEAADVQNNVILNITNGTFDRVFGGNNLSGTIRGSITVNVEETGCKPIKIGELYGGGNQAAYSVYGYKEVTEGGKKVWKPRESADDSGTGPTTPYAAPQVNVKSFTSIGDIYGGGLGTGAVMVGNPTVNINVALGKWATEVVDDNTKTYDDNDGKPIPSHKSGKIGAINNVFGGGNAAKVIGAPSVNIGTTEYEYTTISDSEITVGTTDVSTYYTRTNTGSYEQATGVAQENTTYYKRVAVVGADIRGNVYGGGNNAEVTGNTNVTIGKENAGN